jgi:hypothetical protein
MDGYLQDVELVSTSFARTNFLENNKNMLVMPSC